MPLTLRQRMPNFPQTIPNLVAEVFVMQRTILAALVLSLLFWVCAGSRQASANDAPAILDSYASSAIRPGTSWRVYLRAKDVDGNMRSIVAILSGPGVSPETSITHLKKKQGLEFAGYLFMRTSRDRSLLNNTYKLQVFVRDSTEAKSETVEFPLSFDLKDPQKLPAEWQDVAEKKLGGMTIEIKGERDRVRQGGLF